jgi:hypothetical protein
LRDLGEHRDVVLLVVHHLVCWAHFQLLLGIDYKSCESSGN